MDIKKSMLLVALTLFMILLFLDGGMAQTKRADETIFLSGSVKEISWDRRTIIVNDRKFSISQDALVVDQKENKLKLEDIKQNSDVAIDAVRQQNGYTIIRIVVIKDRGV